MAVEAEAADEEGHHDVLLRSHHRPRSLQRVIGRTGMPEPCL